jgi:ribosome-binding factor A
MTARTEKIDELLRQEISQALEREVTDPRIGFVTVTDVETVADLSRARVWVSIIGSAEERKQTLVALRGAMPFIRRGLGSKIRLRRIPELDVRLDDSIERGTRVLRIISDLEAGQVPDAIAGPGESLPTPVPRLRHEGDSVEETTPGEPAAGLTSKPRAKGSRPNERRAGHGKGAHTGGPAQHRRAR